MADEGSEQGETSVRGNEWEVVSLTASAYAAAPGADSVDKNTEDTAESAKATFLSGHFVFPPEKHENLPIEHDVCQMTNETNAEEAVNPVIWMEEDTPTQMEDTSQDTPDLLDVHDMQYNQDGSQRFPAESQEGECSALEMSSYFVQVESSLVNDPDVAPHLDSSLHFPESPRLSEEDGETDVETWWKRQATSVYGHVKDANAFWSVIVAAAFMGLVIIGRRWQQERWQLHHLRWGLSWLIRE